MFDTSLLHTSYGADRAVSRSPRSIEYDAFARITHALKAASAPDDRAPGALARALHDNNRLWTLIATDVAGDANGLPQVLRARLFYLAEFTARHSAAVLSEKASVDALIDINTAVMRGLRQSGAAA